ncbi:ABC transporter related protein [Candidatus Arthromitus sp. SFB-mouse-SU]|uniref:ABC transporter ATP-binding protein n=1 Tax=Candidatus Arthromitus sp. SFB-mouse TaxID=49118 RepID=UPI00022AE601|nr:ABC transporter ATP-binding protein [Candidatus Arthromitus sp. SFB-mouse]EGX28640.1 ABC transporter, ATP-binding protein [Candidatus Arthromitus sp. SFB-mouse-NYU]EIA26052.1 ABC transporter related protein [Candidatus Arthromitus sp. SFB-4]EIA27356.1 ABC transporter related protein [Candidatus Arthromitus sp. SFB-co]EIA30950.1 ABC transporter related protein [Candidatus Arthromitus sp. SFB-mouse-SU]
MFSLFKYLKKYKFLILLIFFLIFVQSMMELLLPTIMSKVVDEGILNSDMKIISIQGLKMLGVVIVAIIVSLFSILLSSVVSVKFGQEIRRRVFIKVQGFSSKEIDKFGVASLITRTTNDITQVQNVTLLILRMMILGPMMAIGGLIVSMYKDIKLATILLISIPILLIVVFLIGSRAIKIFSKIQKKLDKVNLISRENLTGIRVIRAFNKQKYEEKRFDDANKDLTFSVSKAYRIFAKLIPIMFLIFYFNSLAVVWFGSHRVADSTLMVGDLIAFIQYSNQIMISLMMFFMLFGMIPKAISSAKRINEVLETDFSINDIENVKKLIDSNEVTLKFDNVSFSYNNTGEYDLENINFECKSGDTIAIIGGTGSGKSSILNLITRFYDVTKGRILLNGVDIKDITQKDLRDSIGYVPQKAVLFSGTIRSNLKYGDESATDERMERALKIAQAYEFVSGLEDGIDSYVSQGGTNFSGGQKQRLSISRALVKDSKIYMFDDSFSALDFKTDSKLRAALKENIKNAIVLIIGQRVTSVMHSDKIIVMDNGRIVGIGTHRELLNNCEVYREIAKSQLSEEELS